MSRFHRQELHGAEPLYAGGALYFLQQTLAWALEHRRVALASLRNRRKQYFRMGLYGALQLLRATFGAEVSRG